MEAVFQERDIEVDEEPERQVTETKIGRELNPMDRLNRFDGFELDEELLVDEQVDAVSLGNGVTAIRDGQELLGLGVVAARCQLDAQAFTIGILQQARAEGAMDRQRGIHRICGDGFNPIWNNDPGHFFANLGGSLRLRA